MKENCKKKIFISGPITDTPFYWKAFETARDFYETQGYAVMIPSELPVGMSNADYARVCMAMIDSADEVAFLPGWHESVGARLEHDYCYYTRKPVRLFSDDLKSIDGVGLNTSAQDELAKTLATGCAACISDDRTSLLESATLCAIKKGYNIEFSDDRNGWYTVNLNAPSR